MSTAFGERHLPISRIFISHPFSINTHHEMAPSQLIPSALSMSNIVPPGSSNDMTGAISSQYSSGQQGGNDNSRYTPASLPPLSTCDALGQAGEFATAISARSEREADDLPLSKDIEALVQGLTEGDLQRLRKRLETEDWNLVHN